MSDMRPLYNPDDIKHYPLEIMTIHRFADCTLEAKISGKKYIVRVDELVRDHLECDVIWCEASNFTIGTRISVTSQELRKNLGFVDNFEEEFPEYFL